MHEDTTQLDILIGYILELVSEVDPGFHFFWGGGGQEIMCPHDPTHEREPRSAHLRAWKHSGFLKLSRAIWALFVSILILNGMKKPIVDQFF